VAKIALDIDSTLHDYWPVLDRVARERYGVALPYEEQREWGITRLPQEALIECVRETHSEANILTAQPYPGAVETVTAWHEQGHWIHVTSHRSTDAYKATVGWLERIGMPYDDLHCSYDKVSRCVELRIDVLVDDSPVNLERAAAYGIQGATLRHPWTEGLDGGVIVADDWHDLRRRLSPLLEP
jgi:uncharacterized protein